MHCPCVYSAVRGILLFVGSAESGQYVQKKSGSLAQTVKPSTSILIKKLASQNYCVHSQ